MLLLHDHSRLQRCRCGTRNFLPLDPAWFLKKVNLKNGAEIGRRETGEKDGKSKMKNGNEKKRWEVCGLFLSRGKQFLHEYRYVDSGKPCARSSASGCFFSEFPRETEGNQPRRASGRPQGIFFCASWGKGGGVFRRVPVCFGQIAAVLGKSRRFWGNCPAKRFLCLLSHNFNHTGINKNQFAFVRGEDYFTPWLLRLLQQPRRKFCNLTEFRKTE